MGMARTVLHFPTDALIRGPRAASARARISRPRKTWRLGPLGFAYAAALADVVAILLAAMVTVALHGLMTVGAVTGLPTGLTVGLVVAVLVTLVGVHNRGYAPQNYLSLSGQVSRAFGLWNSASLAALALGVATRAASDFPRASLAVFYVLGFVLHRRRATRSGPRREGVAASGDWRRRDARRSSASNRISTNFNPPARSATTAPNSSAPSRCARRKRSSPTIFRSRSPPSACIAPTTCSSPCPGRAPISSNPLWRR